MKITIYFVQVPENNQALDLKITKLRERIYLQTD